MQKPSRPSWSQVLREERKKRGWSQADLASKIGSAPDTVSRWERGSTYPSADYLRGLLELFGNDESGFLPHPFPTKDSQEKIDQTIRIRINEEPLTAYNINIIISAFIELHTKFWLIQQQRFTDVIGYTQSHNPRFVKEANLLIGKMAHNSPGWLEFMTTHGSAITEALKTVTSIMKTPFQLQAAELENEAKELEIRLKEQVAKSELADKKQNRQIEAQKAALENQKTQLELEDKRLELKRKQLELQEKQLDLEKKRVEIALEIAHKAVDVFPLEADVVTKAMLAETLLPNILQLGAAKNAELIRSTSQEDESKSEEEFWRL
jgi:transcriptional regulator with XRE-family HTH domain